MESEAEKIEHLRCKIAKQKGVTECRTYSLQDGTIVFAYKSGNGPGSFAERAMDRFLKREHLSNNVELIWCPPSAFFCDKKKVQAKIWLYEDETGEVDLRTRMIDLPRELAVSRFGF